MTSTITHSIMLCECIRSRIFSLEVLESVVGMEITMILWVCPKETLLRETRVSAGQAAHIYPRFWSYPQGLTCNDA